MPALSPEQIANNIRSLSTALADLTAQSRLGADSVKILADALNRLQSSGIRQFSNIKGNFDQFLATLKLTGQEAGLTKKQIDGLVQSVAKLRETGRLSFGQEALGGAGRRGVNTTLGGGGDEEAIGRTIAQQRQLYSQILPGGARAIEQVEKSLEGMGLSMNDVNDVTEDASRGTVRWTASIQTTEGVTKRAVVHTNRWGQELRSTQRHLRTFTGAIARDIVEVTKWAIAVAIVYAPLRRLTQLMQEAVQIEAKLADVQVALGSATTSLNVVWEESANVARELGVSVEGVIDGYVLAARATANIKEPTDRAAATTAVLRDSMILAKLAGIDQAIAMDTLVGALRQLNIPLTDGAELIDKWVAVSRAANVSLHTLAESFAITATAAANVGITMDHLNGIIAAVAEVTTLSATESGNAVRAFISGFQSDQSERELARFGIAVRDVNGELLAFTKVIESVIERRDVGLISDRELAKISEIIGGGARRGAQVNAFLENYGRVQELAAVSANASGDAAEALSIKMDTLQTAVQNLNNAFSELAKALGSEGGFLDFARGSVESLTGLVDLLNKIVGVLGKATPAVIAFGAAWLLARRSMRLQGFLDQTILGTLIGPQGGRAFGAGPALAGQLAGRGIVGPQTTLRQGISGVAGFGGGAVGGAAVGGLSALLSGNLQKGNLDRAGAQIAGGVIGALLTGGSPIGAFIGSVIVESVIGGLVDREVDIQGLFAEILTGAYFEAAEEGGPKVAELTGDELREELIKSIAPFSSTLLGQLRIGFAQAVGGVGEREALTTLATVAAGREPSVQGEQISRFFGFQNLTPEDRARIGALLDQIQAEAESQVEDTGGFGPSPFALRLLGVSEEFGPVAASIINRQKQQLLQDVARGEVGVRALQEFLNIGDFEQTTSTIFTALSSLTDSSIQYSDVAETLIGSTEQERQIFTQLAGTIADLSSQYDELGSSTEGFEDFGIRLARRNIGAELSEQVGVLQQFLTVAQQGQTFRAFEAPDVVGLAAGATPEQIRAIVAQTRRLQELRTQAMTPDAAEQEKIRAEWEDIIFQIGDVIDEEWTEVFTGLDTGILAEQIREAGLEAQEAQLGIITPDLPSSQAGQLRGNIAFFENIISQLRPLDREDQGVIFSDYVTDILHADNLAVQLALQTLIDVNEQQLEGIFNIPEGVTAQIPFTGRLFFSDQPIPTAGAGNILEALGPALDQLPGEIEGAAGTAHSDALAQIDVLNSLLASGITSEDLAAVLEERVTALGGEPTARGDPSTGVFWEEIRDGIVGTSRETLAALREAFILNPELKTPFNLGQLTAEDILSTLPQSIPVTINTRIINPITVLVDGVRVQQALEERHYEDLESATRRTGAVGYIME
jgi:TP901 family phage tail tape measure protein